MAIPGNDVAPAIISIMMMMIAIPDDADIAPPVVSRDGDVDDDPRQ